MSFRVLLLLSVVLFPLSRAAFSQCPQTPVAADSPTRQVDMELVLIRVAGTRAERDDVRSGLGKLALLKDRQEFTALVEGLRRRSQVTVLAEPHLCTLLGKPANYFSGGQDELGEPLGTHVNVWPTRMPDGRILLELDISHSERHGDSVKLPGGGLIPNRKTDGVQTSVVLEDSQAFAFAIGGSSVCHEVREVRMGPAVLKDIPLLRDIFCKRQTFEVEVETICLGRVQIVTDK